MKFQTLKPRDEIEGSGLGLAIIKRIVDTHSGRVELSNRKEGGLKAQVCLPISHG